MNNPLLSIVIPFYNLEPWLLERCIESIVCQDVNENQYEIIVVDDGSKDFPHSLLSSFQKENIRYFYQENKGLGGARNTGMKTAKGKYLLFLDSDDYLYEQTLGVCIALLKEAEEKIDILNFRFKTCRRKEKETIRQIPFKRSEIMSGAQYMYTHNLSGCAWLYIFRKALAVKNNLYFTPGILHEDEEFTPQLYFFARKVIETNLQMYAYYQRSDSIVNKKSHTHLNKRFSDFKGVIKRLQEFLQTHKQDSSELQQKALEKKICLLACDYFICMARSFYPYAYIRREINELKKMELYPLPPKPYSYKYNAFRALTKYQTGIRLLYIIEYFRTKLK